MSEAKGIRLTKQPIGPEPPRPTTEVEAIPIKNKSWKYWGVKRLVVGTEVIPLLTGSRPVDKTVVLASSANAGTVYVAPSSPTPNESIPLIANDSVTLYADNLSKYNFIASVADQVVIIWYYWD